MSFGAVNVVPKRMQGEGLFARYRGSLKAYANYAHAFNLPGVWTAIFYGDWGRRDQWKELSAETVDHYEIGLTHVFSKQFQAGIFFFHDSVEDALRLVHPPPPSPLFANIGDYEATEEFVERLE